MSKTGQICDTGVEALHCGALKRPAPFYAKVLEPIDNGPGYWNYLRVGIFQRPEADITGDEYTKPVISDTDVQIGEYKRNYSSLYRTFHPFQLRGKWYALYSKDYTSTRLMSLPDCKDVCGEERDQFGFCPVDFFVPPLSDLIFHHFEGCPRDDERGGKPDYTKACTCQMPHSPECPFVTTKNASCNGCEAHKAYDAEHWEWRFPDRVHGFVAGCIWGDDSSWKIEYLDLSRADEGIIKREARFGYVELASGEDLADAIDYDGEGEWLRMNVQQHFNIRTGKDVHEPEPPSLPVPKFILL
jgi:hypothetical protein